LRPDRPGAAEARPGRARSRHALAAALAVSVAAHVALFAGIPLALTGLEREPVPAPAPLVARLAPPAAATAVTPPAPRTARRAAHRAAAAPAPVLAAPSADFAIPSADGEAGTDSTAEAAPVATATAPTGTSSDPAPAVARTLPRRGEISYVITLGSGNFTVGEAVSRWEIGEQGYRVETLAQTAGFAALVRPQHGTYVSSGRVTEAGLQPERFTASRTRSGRTAEAIALFDWVSREIEYGPPGAPRHAPLAAQAQDIVSLAWHLAMLPLVPGRMEIALTNGWKIETHVVEVGAEEPLETPVGVLRTIPVRQRVPGQRGIEVSLAPGLHMLPVRIRMFDRDGGMAGEQVVSAVRIPQ